MALLFQGCRQEVEAPDYSDFVHVVKKGQFELYVPPYLHPDRNVNQRAAVAYTDSLHNSFLMVYREVIPDTEDDSIEITLDEYAIYAAQAAEDMLTDASLRQQDTLTLSGYPALAMKYTGTYGGHDIWYCLTVVRTEAYFFQVSGWTLKQYADTRGRDLYNSMLTFYPYH